MRERDRWPDSQKGEKKAAATTRVPSLLPVQCDPSPKGREREHSRPYPYHLAALCYYPTVIWRLPSFFVTSTSTTTTTGSMDDELFKRPPTAPYPFPTLFHSSPHLLVRDRYNKVCRKEEDEEEEEEEKREFFGRRL